MSDSERGDSTPEAKAFKETSGFLIEYIENPAVLAWHLFSKNLIEKGVREQATLLAHTKEQKCMALVESLERIISLDQKAFHAFLQVLSSSDEHSNLYEKLKMKYDEIKKKMGKASKASSTQGLGVMESHMPGLTTTLQFMRSLKPKADSEKRMEVIEILKQFIEKSFQGGAKSEDLKKNLADLHLEELLLSQAEYRWAISKAEDLEQSKKIFESESSKVKGSLVSKRKESRKGLLTKEVIYYSSLSCLTVTSCDSSNYRDFLQAKHPHHEFSEASLSRIREGSVDRYLIVKEGKTYYVAFKGELSLTAWKTNYKSFEEGINVQCSRIPLRFFVQQINDGYSVVFTGFSFGGLVACSVAANLCNEPYLTSEQCLSSVLCVTFGQPMIKVPSVVETAKRIPGLKSIIHNVIMENDTFPKLMSFLSDGFEAVKSLESTALQNPFSPLILQYLCEIQTAIHRLPPSESIPQSYLDSLESLKDLLIEVLRSQQESISTDEDDEIPSESVLPPVGLYLGKLYWLSTKNNQWAELTGKKLCGVIETFAEEIKNIKAGIFLKPAMFDYFTAIIRGYFEESPVYSLPPTCTSEISDMSILKPSIDTVAFHQHGKELAVVVEGNNFWFCTQVHVSTLPHINIEPEKISSKSIQFNYTPKDENDIPEMDTIGVQLHSHFTNPIRKANIPVKKKAYRFTYRQEQLAKHTPSELMELAYMSALLEQHPFSEQESLSNRFNVLRKFLEDIVSVVPIESVPYTIASADDDLVGPCCKALIESKIIPLPSSSCMKAGMIRALNRVSGFVEKIQIGKFGLFNFEQFMFSPDELRAMDHRAADVTSVKVEETIEQISVENNKEVSTNDSIKTYYKAKKKDYLKVLKNEARLAKPTKSTGKPHVPLHYKFPHPSQSVYHQYIDLYTAESAYSRFISGFQKLMYPDHNHAIISELIKMAPSPDTHSLDNVICGLDIGLIYPPAGSRVIYSPLDILVVGRKLLSELTKKMSNIEPLARPGNEVSSISQLYNTQMLRTINSIREHNVKLCVNLLGAFMEEQMQVPLKRTSFDTAKAIFSAVSVAAMGVWALFNLSFQDVNALLSSMPNTQLFVQVAEYIMGMFKENKVNLDREYAGKLQFMVQGLDKTVSCNSQYISYSLERQLVLLCDELQISASTPTETLVDKWNVLFKDNVLSLVSISHRPLVARWMRWALMVHNLREELARYTAVGVVGLVNSGKSKLVNSLFEIKIATGTTECKRTTVPFLYNLDQEVEGLDVIDFPGVDDRDETIPDLAELLLSLAQVVIFVVDYRRVHTESVKHWLEHLEKEPVQVLVCLTHVDQLYVEYMEEDDKGHVTHRPADIVRRELKIQLDMIKEKLGSCPRHTIQFYSICQGKDSILNNPKGRKILRDVGIGSPLDVGNWLVNVLEKHLDQQELSGRLKEYIHKDQ